ncbi:MAG: MerR family transcriptional regulator [Anaeromicrobium sp.]|jgi:DNA-binding transcriptional MerR regulator|uniref:MerR family transcriptional regulator n=1 Tax=Anaeromicrobium sp. TaxID=1929132 RepID=UPI0025FB8B64|nr:MerR family transcriptional regulator [Anaeromicrobium sp.]MCT4594711.1 MerR family transcriptional regulator [Anaeromicrobium sp.]
MEKKKQYTISEVSKITEYPTHVLRYYETDFDLEIPRTNSNRRYYTDKEVETFLYIKDLQGKGLTNKQIKSILKSPEVIINDCDAPVAATAEVDIVHNNCTAIMNTGDVHEIQNLITNDLKYKMDEVKADIITHMENLLEERKETKPIPLRGEGSKEKDVLISENARLKMKVKEKSYELAELKDRVKRLEERKGLWDRLFKK